jgi:DNA polymerase-2
LTGTTVKGFLLTRQRVETADSTDLVFWLATAEGPVQWRVPAQETVCFIPSRQLSAARRCLSRLGQYSSADTSLQDFDGQAIAALYFVRPRDLFTARDLLTQQGIIVYEADINAADRYLMERFITGGVELEPAGKRLLDPKARPLEYRPRLRCISVDIETDYQGEQLYSIGVYCADSRIVFMVDSSPAHRPAIDPLLRLLPDERAVIEAFLAWVTEWDPDVLLGWNVVNFDLRVLQACCDRLGIPFRLGRDGEIIGWRQARDSNARYFALVPGRVILDGIELMRSATYQFENFSLDHVASQLLGRGKLVDDVDQRHAEITRLFQEDKPALARYNLEDCRLVWDIFQQEKLVEFAIERSLLTGLELQRYGGSVAAFDFLYLPRLHRSGYVAPALHQTDSQAMSPGGYVMESRPGIYDHVLVLDFKSLYPSIIRTFRIDPLGLVLGLRESDAVPGFDGGRFSRHHHILPQLIEHLWQARDRAKAEGNRVLSQAIKIIMNSFYGVLGTNGCRFHDHRLVSSITRRGHQIIIESKQFIEERGWQVIYGDTDSLFVHVGNPAGQDPDAVGQRLARELNEWWRERIRTGFDLESCLEIQFETHFTRFLMPTIRGSDTGSKKRYAGLIRKGGQHATADYEIVFKGLESVRSDWSPLARRFQQDLYRRIFLDQPYEAYIRQTVKDVMEGRFEAELVLRRRLRRRLKDYVKNVPPHVQAARRAEAMRRQMGLPSLYDQGGWIEYIMTVNGPEPRQYRQSPVDYEFYLERQIKPVADSILVFKSTSMEELLTRQIGLF